MGGAYHPRKKKEREVRREKWREEMEGVFFSYAVLERATTFESGFWGSSFASIRLKS